MNKMCPYIRRILRYTVFYDTITVSTADDDTLSHFVPIFGYNIIYHLYMALIFIFRQLAIKSKQKRQMLEELKQQKSC
uniref:TLC domain-containing protein n=1 Tax=Steinernema glaseri TaxID=37863 RepID=A0A1I8A4E6_9BILA